MIIFQGVQGIVFTIVNAAKTMADMEIARLNNRSFLRMEGKIILISFSVFLVW
ncbi:MAG: hypothetical protein AAB521_00655 [Patescibacteria group bacterium]